MNDPPRPSHLPPGADKEDPYEGEDISTYPDWWRSNVQEFRRFGLRPYRPPRFEDGKIVAETLDDLEAKWGIEIRLYAEDPGVGENWTVAVDGERIAEVPWERLGEGYTLYEIDSDAFEGLVREAVTGNTVEESD